ncbi:MAG: phage tail protein [Cetobacterium sp.]
MAAYNKVPYAEPIVNNTTTGEAELLSTVTKKLIDLDMLSYFKIRLYEDIRQNPDMFVPNASKELHGVVKIGENIEVSNDGVISVSKLSWDNIDGVPDIAPKTHTHESIDIMDATNENVPNTIVKRDVNGAIKVTRVEGSLKGNADTAGRLLTPVKINNILFDGSEDIDITIPVATRETAGIVIAGKNIDIDGDGVISSNVDLSVVVTKDELYLANSPIGSIIAFAGDVVPLGYLSCDGRTISMAEYPELFDLVGDKIPDLRGKFIRGIDAGRLIGSSQEDSIKVHKHLTELSENGQVIYGEGLESPIDTSETRPINVAFNYIIKASYINAGVIPVTPAEELNNKIETNYNNQTKLIIDNFDSNKNLLTEQNLVIESVTGMETGGYIQDDTVKVVGVYYIDRENGNGYMCIKSGSNENTEEFFIDCNLREMHHKTSGIYEKISEKMDRGDYTGTAHDLYEDLNYSQVPIGTVTPFIGDITPLGWLQCDGSEIEETDYPQLYPLLQNGGSLHITEEDIAANSKHVIPVLTSNTDKGYTVTTSSEYSSAYSGFEAFDNSTGDSACWITANALREGWLQVMYPTHTSLGSFQFTARSGVNKGREVDYIKMVGIGVDGVTETILFDELVPVFTPNESRVFQTYDKTSIFSGYRIYIKSRLDYGNTYVAIGELKLNTHTLAVNAPQVILDQDPNKKYLPYMNGMTPKGRSYGRDLGSFEMDGIRNITGTWATKWNATSRGFNGFTSSGCYEPHTDNASAGRITCEDVSGNSGCAYPGFNASRSVPVSNQNKVQNISFNYIIKASNVKNPSTAVDIADELNLKIENYKKDYDAINSRLDSLETEDTILWEGQFTTNGIMTLSESFKNFRMIAITVGCIVSSNFVDRVQRLLTTADIPLNDTNIGDNLSADHRFYIDYGANGYNAAYFRTNCVDIYFNGRTGTGAIAQVKGIGRVNMI